MIQQGLRSHHNLLIWIYKLFLYLRTHENSRVRRELKRLLRPIYRQGLHPRSLEFLMESSEQTLSASCFCDSVIIKQFFTLFSEAPYVCCYQITLFHKNRIDSTNILANFTFTKNDNLELC